MCPIFKKANKPHLRKWNMDAWAEGPMNKNDFVGRCLTEVKSSTLFLLFYFIIFIFVIILYVLVFVFCFFQKIKKKIIEASKMI